MANTLVANSQDNTSKFLESLQADLKVLASESKKKYPQIKEVSYNYLYFFNTLFYCVTLNKSRLSFNVITLELYVIPISVMLYLL